MHDIGLLQFIVWLIISAIVGFIAEFVSRRRAPEGFLGTIMVGLLAIFVVVGFFGFSIHGDPTIEGVPIFSSIIAAIMVVLIWNSLAYGWRR